MSQRANTEFAVRVQEAISSVASSYMNGRRREGTATATPRPRDAKRTARGGGQLAELIRSFVPASTWLLCYYNGSNSNRLEFNYLL